MRQILTLLITLFTMSAIGQQMTLKEWEEQSKTDIRLLPKYGHRQKTENQKQLDEKFIKETMQQEAFKGNRTIASNQTIKLGFNYLYRGDLKTAMYRFNQAYLLDQTNTDIFWGFGAVYLQLGLNDQAKKQYEEGLTINPKNTHLLTDYGTYYLIQYYGLQSKDKKSTDTNLDSAINYMTKSYLLDNKDQNTTFKLSVCYMLKGDCNNAWKYYDECKALGGKQITEKYTNDLMQKCKRTK